jgi:hypothetical protein
MLSTKDLKAKTAELASDIERLQIELEFQRSARNELFYEQVHELTYGSAHKHGSPT